jgi:type IV pilus assembly protein PilP
MQNYVRFSNILLFLVCFSFIFTGYQVFAETLRKPVVIRKKIVPQNDVRTTSVQSTTPKSKSEIDLLKPKLEISQLLEEKKENGFESDEILLAAAGSSESTKQAYDPAGKIDPFEPLFQEKVNSLKPEITPIIDQDRKKGPLELIDTSQLKLTGIIYATGRNLALVQEASGKGHVIKKGSYIGTKGGKVIEILNKKVIIGEKWQDNDGNIYNQKTN